MQHSSRSIFVLGAESKKVSEVGVEDLSVDLRLCRRSSMALKMLLNLKLYLLVLGVVLALKLYMARNS